MPGCRQTQAAANTRPTNCNHSSENFHQRSAVHFWFWPRTSCFDISSRRQAAPSLHHSEALTGASNLQSPVASRHPSPSPCMHSVFVSMTGSLLKTNAQHNRWAIGSAQTNKLKNTSQGHLRTKLAVRNIPQARSQGDGGGLWKLLPTAGKGLTTAWQGLMSLSHHP